MNRRELFSNLLRPWKVVADEVTTDSQGTEGPMVAELIQGSCLAYQRSFCSSCVERCPEPGAIVKKLGRPEFFEESCTGCGVCVGVCPAPRKAIRMVQSQQIVENL